jgi:hypothetical protein
MYLIPLLHTVTEALKHTFDDKYPVEQFRSLQVGIEYPAERQDYPAIWVDYDPTDSARTVGIGHEETILSDEKYVRYKRWRFTGTITHTVVTLSSYERALLHDELVKVFAFGAEDRMRVRYRDALANNDFIAVDPMLDEVVTSGMQALPGTPWGTNDVIYEVTLSITVTGEFVSDGLEQSLVPLERIDFYPYEEGTPDPRPIGEWLGDEPLSASEPV